LSGLPNVTLAWSDFSGDRFVGTDVTYTCNNGYTFNVSDPLDSQRTIKCLDDQTWEKWSAADVCRPQQETNGTSRPPGNNGKQGRM
jgi:hypothetical protein